MYDSTKDSRSSDVRLGRIVDAYLKRCSAGEPTSDEELLAGHPECAQDLREMLNTIRRLRPAEAQTTALVRQGILDPPREPHDLAALGEYRITGLIGCGGMGLVLKAYGQSLKRAVALKILRPELADDPTALARFQREARVMASLRHVNLITVHAVGQVRRAVYIAMEFVDGPSLADLIKKQLARHGRPPDGAAAVGKGGRRMATHAAQAALGSQAPPLFSADFTRRVFRELLVGLDVAHRAGLIHRDIKSSNILLDRWSVSDPQLCGDRLGCTGDATSECDFDGRKGGSRTVSFVKLADFGLARMRTSQTRLTLQDAVLGTPEYMSPEQARGEVEIDHRTDLYAAGVVLYEMLTGRTPFRAETPTAILRRILDEEPPDPRGLVPTLDPGLASIALRLLEKRPEDRYQSAREALTALDSKMSVQLPTRRRRLFRTVCVGSACALMLLSLGMIWVAFRQPGQIVAARVDPDNNQALQVEYARYPGRYVHFARFPGLVAGDERRGRVAFAHAVRDGQPIVVAAEDVTTPGKCDELVGFAGNGRECWRVPIVPPERIPWPDCAGNSPWTTGQIAVADLDGRPGEEFVVLAHDPLDYGTRIVWGDPRDGTMQQSFWHLGHLMAFSIIDGILPGRPAIVAWGMNNKLDGFAEPLPDDAAPSATCDIVPVVVILDPADMDGLGPPLCPNRLPRFTAARPRAYAFMDMPTGPSAPEQVKVAVATVEPVTRVDGGVHVRLKVVFDYPHQEGGFDITVDDDLGLRLTDVHIGSGAEKRIDAEHVYERWHVLVRNGTVAPSVRTPVPQ